MSKKYYYEFENGGRGYCLSLDDIEEMISADIREAPASYHLIFDENNNVVSTIKVNTVVTIERTSSREADKT